MELATSLSSVPASPPPAATVVAPATSSPQLPSAAAGVASMLGSLALVLVLIFVFAWLARRLQGRRAPRGGELRIEGGLQLGAKERVVVLQAGDTRLLLGVAAGRISLLHRYGAAAHAEVETPEVSAPALPRVSISPFGEQLRKLFAVK